ncbi:unnamed protein product [Prorocentrum cordatum]|uniref:Uncharacterized protein n=1 Tax=Prorocentrum cordatum TaxID=2364126 RepID=A0ABN9TDZ1_9DINO|nr:unnamed protein product [Polarella glacialis]
MAGVLSTHTKQRLDELIARGLQSSTDGVNAIFLDTIEILKGEHLIRLVRNENAAKFFAHPRNRFGLGLSPHQAHRAGAKICGIGADKAALTNAFAIGMQVEGPMRQAAVDFNRSVITRSNGMLAQPTGQEMYLAVGRGHTVAFCRAAQAGCSTPNEKIKDGSGTIDIQKLFKDKVFKSMIQDGWDWWIISAVVDRECPRHADLAQKALNANNHVASLIGEVEAAQMMAEYLKDGDQADDNLEEMAQESVRSMGCPCSPYVDSIIKFVRIYAGGIGAPHIQFIDKVAKQFHATGVTFYDSSGQYPLIRNAMVLANLTSNTREDGIAKLLSRTDVVKVASKAKAETAAECEATLRAAAIIVKFLRGGGKIKPDDELGPLGRIWVRVALYATDKGNKGDEARPMELPDIQSQFLDELSAAVGAEVTCDSWESAWKKTGYSKNAEDAGASAAPCKKPKVVADMQDHEDPAWICSQKGIFQGCIVIKKDAAGDPEGLHKLVGFADGVQLQQLLSYVGAQNGIAFSIAVKGFMDKWTLYNGTALPKHWVDGESPTACPGTVYAWGTDWTKAGLFIAIHEIYEAHDDLKFFRCPDVVMTKREFKKGALVLAPMVPLSNISLKKTAGAWGLGKHNAGKQEFFATKPVRQPATAEIDASYGISAFWWVKTSGDTKAVNMHTKIMDHLGVSIPCLCNTTRAIKAHETLVCFKK